MGCCSAKKLTGEEILADYKDKYINDNVKGPYEKAG